MESKMPNAPGFLVHPYIYLCIIVCLLVMYDPYSYFLFLLAVIMTHLRFVKLRVCKYNKCFIARRWYYLRRARPNRALNLSRIMWFFLYSLLWLGGGVVAGIVALVLPPLLDGILAADPMAAMTKTIELLTLGDRGLLVTVPAFALISSAVGTVTQLIVKDPESQRRICLRLNGLLAFSPIMAVLVLKVYKMSLPSD